jgi:hypothetical protein
VGYVVDKVALRKGQIFLQALLFPHLPPTLCNLCSLQRRFTTRNKINQVIIVIVAALPSKNATNAVIVFLKHSKHF